MASDRAKQALAVILSLAVLGGLAFGGVTLHAKRVAALENAAPPTLFPWALRSARVQKRDLTNGFPALATLSSRSEIAITPQITGVITQMGPREGQAIRKGWLLAQLDTQEIDDNIAALKASHQAAKDEQALQEKEFKRQETLLTRGFATQERVDRVRTALRTATQRVNQLRGQIEALKTRLRYGTILAPRDGIIAARLQEPGDLATPGRAIYRITAATGAKIRVTVPQAVAERLREGGDIVVAHGAQTVTVKISRVFPSLDALSMGTAEADLDAIPFGLPSGARAPGRVILDRWPGALVLPRSALILTPDGTGATVFRIVPAADDGPGRLQRLQVKIIASGREGVAVAGDIAENDLVAVAQETQLLRLHDGDPVQPAYAPSPAAPNLTAPDAAAGR